MSGDDPRISDETLLGYLIGALTDEESAWIEEVVASSPSLRQRLSDLRSMLEPLALDEESFEPPADLVQQTMASIGDAARNAASRPQAAAGIGFKSPVFDWQDVPIGVKIAWVDSLVSLAAGIVFLSFLLPAVWVWRESARRTVCQDNVRKLGDAIQKFGNITATGRIPSIDRTGALSFAGVYSLRLRDFGLLDSVAWLRCPSSDSVVNDLPAAVPNSRQFLNASPDEQVVMRFISGGSYAFNLGNRVDGSYITPNLDQPFQFAMLGDTWLGRGSDSARMDELIRFDEPIDVHGIRAVNVLYNDGSVRWLRIPDASTGTCIDNPYLNDRLQQAPGEGKTDACLGPSPCTPLRSMISVR